MQKLTQLTEVEYFLGKTPVTPHLAYGPISYTYNYADEQHRDLPIDSLVEQVQEETGVDLEKIANSYHSGGISIAHNQINTRHEIIFFFKSTPKTQN